MSKEMLDVLVDKKKVEEIAVLPTNEDVENALKKEGVSGVTSKDVEVLGNIFKTVSEKGPEAVDEKLLASVGGGITQITKNRLKKAGIAAVVIAGIVGTAVVGHQGHKKGWFNIGSGDPADDGTKTLASPTPPASTTLPATPPGGAGGATTSTTTST